MNEDTCQELIRRQPQLKTEEWPSGRDYSHLQRCGRPVERDGLCAVHLRRAAVDHVTLRGVTLRP